MKAWKCTVCNYIHKGDTPPDKCPVCGAGPDKFVEIEIPDSQEKTAAAPANASGAAPDSSPPAPDTSKQSGGIATTEEKKTASTGPQTLYQRITDLMIRHHAHPILVHTPNGILPAAAVLFILAWLFDATLPAKAAVINLIFVVLALPLVLYTGFLEWQKKYNQAYTLLFKLKILAAALTSAACVISMVWYLADPAVLSTPLAWVFIFINIVMLASAGVAGFIGGKLVFKD
ncbi:MAG: DUF2231 domain-containing protein [Desulfotignum sp.]|nr:DUF2231 domain-containing protein [Desulfotignum sp.]